jgi:1,4-alpha-glucan branching enzyme
MWKELQEFYMLKKRFFKTKDEVEVTFELDRDGVESAAVCIDENEWQPVKMSRRRSDDVFYTKVRLPKDGEYQFRYLLNGEEWINDAEADAYRPNEFGAENSVVITSNGN